MFSHLCYYAVSDAEFVSVERGKMRAVIMNWGKALMKEVRYYFLVANDRNHKTASTF